MIVNSNRMTRIQISPMVDSLSSEMIRSYRLPYQERVKTETQGAKKVLRRGTMPLPIVKWRKL
jgi:hypothetical protein